MLFDTLNTKEKAEQFRIDRLKKIETGGVWSPMSEGPYCVLHWLPISKKALFKVDDFKSVEISKYIGMRSDSKLKRLNVDGIKFSSSEKDEIKKAFLLPIEGDNGRDFWNVQIFHSGALEIAFALSFRDNPPGTKWIYQGEFIKDLWGAMDGFRRYMSSINVNVPMIVGVSLLRVLDYRFSIDEHKRFITGNREQHQPADREQIILPMYRIENLQEVQNIEDIDRSILDILWQSFGFEKCEYYDEDGKRIGFDLNEDEQKKAKQERIDSLIKWFRENYQHPEVELPYDKEEGKYIFVYGGPYNAHDVLTERFKGETEEIINAAVKEIESDGTFEWSPTKHEGYDEGENLTHKSNSEAIHKDIKTKLNTVQKATPLAESFEWNSSNQKIRHIPVSVSDTALWKNVLERLYDEISDIKNNNRLSNTHAALIPVIEKLESKIKKYKNSPQRIHDEIDTTLSDVKWLENEGEIASDLHTQRLKKILTDCALDIIGDVPKVQEAVEKRKKLRLAQISEEEQKSLSSITEDVIPYIEEERIQQDMQEDIEVLRENQNATDSQEKTFKIYRLISRLSRMFILLLKNDPDIWRAIKLSLINKFIEIIFKVTAFF